MYVKWCMLSGVC